jgi:heme-degrading monooxygenase HmoA
MQRKCHLAQVNIARGKGSISDPVMAGFVAQLDKINALADGSPGFVWRLKTEEGNATALQPYDDERILVNLSVWESPDHLKQFVYRSAHAQVVRQRKSWFERFDQAYMAMWWIAPGHVPTIAEAKERLAYLQRHGDSEFAFSFSSVFASPGGKPAGAQPACNDKGEEIEHHS